MRILMIGDIIGQPGRRAIRKIVPDLRSELDIDLVIANGENTAGDNQAETREEMLQEA